MGEINLWNASGNRILKGACLNLTELYLRLESLPKTKSLPHHKHLTQLHNNY